MEEPMKKLRMDLTTLAVQSFEIVDPATTPLGTVFGREAVAPTFGYTACYTRCACPPTPLAL
jgi:tetrahydromethanopterin S-methyltransferase subunit B